MDEHLKRVQSEVDEMNKSFDEDLDASTESPGTEVPITDLVTTEAPGTESPKTEPPKTEAPSTEAPTTEVPDERDKTIEDLRAKIDDLEGGKKPKTEVPTTDVPLQLDEQDFLGDLDLDDLIRDPKGFNKILNDIYQKTMTDTRKVLGEGILRTIPDIVKSNIVTMTNLQKASEEFYGVNKDLKPFKKIVAAVFEELASENPDKRYDEIIKNVGSEVRKRLDLQKQATKPNPKPDPTPPNLPRRKGRSGKTIETPSLTGIEAEIAEMNETLTT